MPRQRVRQDQIKRPDPADDTLSPDQIADNSGNSAQNFLERIISQIKQILGMPNWHDIPPVTLVDIVLGGAGAVVSDDNNGLAPRTNGEAGEVLIDDGGEHPVWRPISSDDLAPAFNASLSGGGTLEIGQSVINPAFTASYSGGSPTSATLTDTEAHPPVSLSAPYTSAVSPHTFQKTTNNATVTFTLSAVKGGTTRTPTASYVWRPRLYWGIGAAQGSYNEAFIEALASSALAANRLRTLSLNPSNERMFYAIPTSYGTPTFTIGPFSGGWSKVATISVTSAYGATQNYDLWATDNDVTGPFDVVVT